MTIETIRCVTAGLSNATYGVNSQLATLSLDGSDTRPVDIALITDETQDFDAALDLYPQTLPAVVVTLDSATVDIYDMNGDTDGTVTLLVGYFAEDSNSVAGITNASYVVRAIEKALIAFASNAHADDRVRNSVNLMQMKTLEHGRTTRFPEDKMITAGVRVSFHVRDTNS